MELNEGNNR